MTDPRWEPFARPTWWQRIRHKFTNKPVKYLTGSGKAPTDSRDALPQSDGDAFRAPDAGTGLMFSHLFPRVPITKRLLTCWLRTRKTSVKALMTACGVQSNSIWRHEHDAPDHPFHRCLPCHYRRSDQQQSHRQSGTI